MSNTLDKVMDELKAIRLEMRTHAKEKGIKELKQLIMVQAEVIDILQEKVVKLEKEVKTLKARYRRERPILSSNLSSIGWPTSGQLSRL